MVPLCDSFFFLAFIWPPKAKGCATAVPMAKKHNTWSIKKNVRIVLVYSTHYTSYVQITRIVVVYSARAYIIVYICGAIKCGNKMMAYCPLSQGSDSGETPLFVGFSHLGNIVEQRWSPYEVYCLTVHTFSLAPCC